jgi:hypothetical protein
MPATYLLTDLFTAKEDLATHHAQKCQARANVDHGRDDVKFPGLHVTEELKRVLTGRGEQKKRAGRGPLPLRGPRQGHGGEWHSHLSKHDDVEADAIRLGECALLFASRVPVVLGKSGERRAD